MDLATNALASALKNVSLFSRAILRKPLRAYQVQPAAAIIEAAIRRRGDEIIMRFPRQTGKNETVAITEAMLLFLFQRAGGTIVHTAPTYQPQAENARNRLIDVTRSNPFFAGLVCHANVITFKRASIVFLSGQTREHPIVGPTANIALFADEAQDLDELYFQRAFSPMTASTNAPIIYTGTARHDQTLLAKRRRAAEARERQDGRRRVFVIHWREVEREVPAYGAKVRAEIECQGAQHPIIRSEYENIEDEQTGKLFDARRIALITATPETRHTQPRPGAVYVLTVDVGGTALTTPCEGGAGGGSGTHEHDATVCAVHLITFTPQRQPIFTTVDYLALWGKNVLDNTPDRARLFAYIKQWSPRRVVVDATGLGVGLASALVAAFPDVVKPVTLSASIKTDLLNQFLALIETGRYKHYMAAAIDGAPGDINQLRALAQFAACVAQQRTPSTGSPSTGSPSTGSPSTGSGGTHIAWGIDAAVLWTNPRTLQREPLHDDHLLACAFTGLLAGAPLSAAYVGAQVQAEREREPEHAHNAQANPFHAPQANSNAPRRRM